MPRFAQIVEREIWRQEGWQWLNYDKAGEVLATNEDKMWAEVRIDFASRNRRGHYQARVEMSDHVTTMGKSNKDTSFRELKQYRVSSL
ncbi:MAG: hypothetical protein ACFB4I_19490 [Cyanophyceae cyanobacterium]